MKAIEHGSNNLVWRLMRLLCCIAYLATNQGCQYAPKMTSTAWPWSKKAAAIPDRILAVWTDSVLHQPGLPGVRGFGGRIYFYQAPNTDPIKVQGAVAVYIFDADQSDPSQQQPLRKYVFTAEQLDNHMSKSSIGPSYSLWLPWDEVGGPSRRLSLITRFEATQGGTVISDPAIKLLPGIPATGVEQKSPSDIAQSEGPTTLNARMVVHQQTQEPVVTASQLGVPGVQTIDLPPSFQQHIRREASTAVPEQLAKPPNLRSDQPLSQPASASSNDQTVIPASGTFTQVIDSRSRRGFQPSGNYQPRTGRDRDIREGRGLEPPRPRSSAISVTNPSPE
jgi:hypothetical protein